MPKYKKYLYNLFINNNDINTYLVLIMLYDQHFIYICSNVHFHFSINMNVTNYDYLPSIIIPTI